MPTLNDLARDYAEYLENNARNSSQALQEVANKIKSLRYTETQEPISVEDRIKLVADIEAYLKNKKGKEGHLILESSVSISYINMLNQIRELVKK